MKHVHNGEALRAILKEKNVKQSDFASKMQFGVSYLHQLFKEEKFKKSLIDQISDVIGEDLSSQFTVSEERSSGFDFQILLNAKDETIKALREQVEDLRTIVSLLRDQIFRLNEDKKGVSEIEVEIRSFMKTYQKQQLEVTKSIAELSGQLKM